MLNHYKSGNCEWTAARDFSLWIKVQHGCHTKSRKLWPVFGFKRASKCVFPPDSNGICNKHGLRNVEANRQSPLRRTEMGGGRKNECFPHRRINERTHSTSEAQAFLQSSKKINKWAAHSPFGWIIQNRIFFLTNVWMKSAQKFIVFLPITTSRWNLFYFLLFVEIILSRFRPCCTELLTHPNIMLYVFMNGTGLRLRTAPDTYHQK